MASLGDRPVNLNPDLLLRHLLLHNGRTTDPPKALREHGSGGSIKFRVAAPGS